MCTSILYKRTRAPAVPKRCCSYTFIRTSYSPFLDSCLLKVDRLLPVVSCAEHCYCYIATMAMSSWDEQPLEFPTSLLNAPKMTRVKTERTLTGDLNGQGLDHALFASLLANIQLIGVAFYNLVYHPSDSPDPHMGTATF